MEKRISFRDFQSVRAVAHAIDPHLKTIATLKKDAVALKAKYDAKAAKLNEEFSEKLGKIKEEFESYQNRIDALEAGVVTITGFHVADLVKKVIEPTGAVDKKGRPVKKTDYLPTDIVHYDEETKQFVITVPDEDAAKETEAETEVETPEEEPAEEEIQVDDVPEEEQEEILPF